MTLSKLSISGHATQYANLVKKALDQDLETKGAGIVSADDNEPRCVALRVKVAAETRHAAARIARDYSGRKLETVVAAFVADLAVAAERPGSWEHERVAAWLASHVWECEPHD